MRSRLLLFLLLLLPAWAAWAQAPAWQSAYGVPASARAVAAATNAAGDVFITGTYSSATTFGSTQLSSAGNSVDVFLAKWSNTSRTFVWAVSVNGTGTDQAGDVAVNGANVYLTGGYKGSATISGTPQTSVGTGALNIFVAKYTDGGTSVSNGGSVSSGNTGSRTSYGSGIAVSGANVYVTGTFGTSATIAGTALTGTAGSFFLAKYVDSNGLTNGGAVTASSSSTVRGIDVAVSGTSPINIYVTGFYRTSTANTGVTTISGTGLSSDGVNDAFLAKYTDSGSGITNGVAVKAGGNDGADTGQAVAVSGSSVYLIGSYGSTTGTFGSSTLTNPNGGSNGLAPAQGFVAKYIDGGNTLTGSTAYVIGNPNSAANSSDSATPFGVAASGSTVYVTGSFSGTVNISGTPFTTSNGSEIFLGKYTDAGGAFTQDGAIRAGGTGNGSTGFDDVGYAVAFSGTQAVVAGTLESSTTASFGTASVAAGSTSFLAYLAQPTTTVVSIVPANASPTNAASVQFTVTFAASVTGLSTTNFTTSNGTGVTGSSVTSVSGSGTTYTVTVNTGSGSGTLGLTLANDTGLTPGISNDPFTGTPLYTIDKTAPTVAISSTTANGGNTSTSPIAYTVTFSESVTGFVAGDVAVGNGTLSGFTAVNGTTYTFNVTPSANGAVTVNIAANVAVDAVGNGNTAASQYSLTYTAPNVTVTSVTRLTPSPTATNTVSYRVVFSGTVTGLSASNFNLTTSAGLSGTIITSVFGSGTTYTVVVNTGTGSGTLTLNVANSTNVSPTISNVPYSGEQYTITKSFAAAPTLRIQAAGSNSGNGDVTAFVDVVQVLQSGTSTAVANGVQNASFETNNVDPSSFKKTADGVVASPWAFTGLAGVSRNGSGFGSTAADGNAVALIQSAGDNNASVSQNLAVPSGSYQINFRAMQRNYTSLDQRLNVFVNDVFVGTIQPNNIPTYDTFTSATFSVTAPALTATISSSAGASGSTTATSPLPFTVTFSQSVTGFIASDVTVANGTLSGFTAVNGTTYTFNVTPTTPGTATTVNVPANVAVDGNNTGNTAATQYSLIYAQPVTAAPVVIVPSNGSLVSTTTPTYGGTAPANSLVTVYVDNASIGTTTANSAGNWALTQPSFLGQGQHAVYATAQASGATVSPNSATNTFTVDTVRPTVAISATTANGGNTSTSPIPYTITFSENVTGFVAGDVAVAGGTLSGFTGSGTTYSFNVTPSGAGTVTVDIAANVAQDQAGNGNTAASQYSITYQLPTVTVASVTRLTPSPTATTQVSYRVVFSGSVAGLGLSNFTLTTSGLSGANVTSVFGSGTTYTVVVNTGTGDGTLTLNVANSTNVSPTISNVPYTSGEQYTITKSFAAAPTLRIQAAGSASGNSDVTAFVDVVQVLQSGTSTVVANGVQNGSFETNNVSPNDYLYQSQGVVASPWSFASQAGVSRGNNAFGSTPASGDAVALLQSRDGNNGSVTQNLAVPSGSYQINFRAMQRNYTSLDQRLNVFVNDVFVGTIQPNNIPTYDTFTSAAFNVTAPALTATVSTTSASPTSTSPLPFSVSFSQSVGSTFTASDVTVANGAVTSGSFGGSGAGPYTFTVTPSGVGTVTVSLAANVAQDANNTGNAASNSVSVQFQAPTLAITPNSLPQGTQGTAYSQALSASGGTAPYTFAITAGSLPAGLTLSSSGTIAGTPTANGTFNFTVTATDNSAPVPGSGSRSYTLVIAAPAVTAVTWTGTVSTDWFTANNWSPNTVPSTTISATIPTAPTGGRFPNISAGTAQARNFTLNSGASLTQSGGTLVVAGDLTNNGTFQPTGGTVTLGSSTLSNVFGASNTRFWNLTVGANGAQQSTSASTSVQRLLLLNGNFATNGNSFTLNSTPNLTAQVTNNAGVVNGNVTVQRFIDPSLNPNLGYRHITTAVSGQTVSSLATGNFSPVVNPAYNASAQPGTTTPFPTVYGYDQSRLATATNNLSTFDKGWFSPNALSDALNVGQGYTALISGNQTWAFTGPLNNGTQTLNLARNTGATASESGLSLVGNPYPSPLDWRQVVSNGLSNVDASLYVFQSNDPTNPYTGQYGVYANGVGTISPILAQGQGFFVRVTAGQANGTLTFANSQRPTTYTTTNYARTAAETRPLVQLSLKAAGHSTGDDAFVYFEQGSTEGFDSQYDARKLPNPSGLNLSTTVGSEQFSIDGRPAIGTVQRVIPLAVGVPAAGAYSLSSAQLLNLDTTPVYLRDLQTGALVDLAQQPTYQFTVSNASALITGRFELVFSPQKALATVPTAIAQQVALYPNPAKTAAFVELPASLGRQAVTATLVDALGREVRTVSLPAQGATAHQLDLHELATGVYALRLSTSAGVVVKKLVVE